MTETLIHITDHQTDEILDTISETDYWSDIHYKTKQGNIETFQFISFGDKPFTQFLTKRNRLVIPDEDNKLIEFFIINVNKFHKNGSFKCEVLATATYVTLKTAKIIRPHTTGALSAEAHAIEALASTEWEIGTVDFNGTRTITFDDYSNPYAYLNKIASEFGLELHFRVESNGNRIVRRYVDLVEKSRNWQGREIEFGKDLQGIERREDTSNIVTALLGLGPIQDDGARLEVLVEDQDALQRWGRNGQHIIEPYEPQFTSQDVTEDRIRTLTQNELNKRINSIVEYHADVVDLENIEGLEHEKFRFGDTIRIKDLKFSPPLYLEARVHSVSRSIKNKGRKVVELGDFIEYEEEDVLKIVTRLQKELDNKITLNQLSKMAVLLDQDYNGAKFTESGGFESIRNDELVRVIGNATVGFAIQKRATVNDPWVNQVYIDTNGNAIFAGEVNGVTGTFGQVEVKNGDFLLVDDVSNDKTTIRENSNMVNDHSFEYVMPYQSIESFGELAAVFSVDPSRLGRSTFNWWNNTSPPNARIMVSMRMGSNTLHGQRSAVLRPQNYGIWEQIVDIPRQFSNTQALSLSAYVSSYEQTTFNPIVSLRLQLVDKSGTWIRDLATDRFNLDHTKKYDWQRISVTYQGAISSDDYRIRIRIFLDGTSSAAFCLCDGVQLVPFEHPSFYYPETGLYRLTNGYDKASEIDTLQLSADYGSFSRLFASSIDTLLHNFLSLQSGWVAYGGIFQTPRYTKLADGIVALSGMMRNGTIGDVAFILPVGCRPNAVETFRTQGYNGGADVYVYPNGEVRVINGSPTNVSISGISFLAEK